MHFGQKVVHHDRLRAMTAAVTHRGPDGEGTYVDDRLGFGHRRLSIIDLSGGHQPMLNVDGTLAITFNGEIYNYIELREELKRLGYRFQTESDTEVILHAYDAWDTACQTKFNGMWAFAIWDRRRRRLFLSRDRIGEKPLYYATFDNSLLFGSEIKSIFAYGMPCIPRTELQEIYLTLGYIPAPNTFYKNVLQLRPGHYLLAEDGRTSVHEYWRFPQVHESDMLTDGVKVCAEFSELLHDSVRLRMRSDVPFGAFLSGGLDSASIVSLMTEYTDHPVETFTIGFDEPDFDERALARDVAHCFHTNHHEYVVRPEILEDSVIGVLRHYDEPFGDSSAIPTGHICRYTRQYVKMALTGDGGDEVLSGYTVYQGEKFAHQYQKLPEFVQKAIPCIASWVSRPITGNLRYTTNRIASVCSAAATTFASRLINKLAYVRPAIIKEIAKGLPGMWPVEDFINGILGECCYADSFYKLMYFQFTVTLPDQMLRKVDRMSMANSLETRIPFLDHRLVEFMATVSKDLKMPGYRRKHVLRRSVARSLPPSLLSAPKKGFSVPLREWFKGNTLDNQLEQLQRLDFGLRNDVIRRVIDDNKQGRSDNGNFIWMLILLARWSHTAGYG